jgi:hypothetical protein
MSLRSSGLRLLDPRIDADHTQMRDGPDAHIKRRSRMDYRVRAGGDASMKIAAAAHPGRLLKRELAARGLSANQPVARIERSEIRDDPRGCSRLSPSSSRAVLTGSSWFLIEVVAIFHFLRQPVEIQAGIVVSNRFGVFL